MLRLVFLIALVALLAAGAQRFAARHPEHLPWTPLDADAPVGWATRAKLARLGADPAACRAWLAREGVAFTPVPDRVTAPGCGFTGAVRLSDPGIRLRPGDLTLTCPVAAALTIWVRQAVQPAAARQLGSEVVALVNYGSYSCRSIAGTDRPSEHATANAIDIAGFRTRDGREIALARDWARPDARGAFLRDAAQGACAVFGTVLGPGYNAAHADHLHLDMGNWNFCAA